MKSNTANVSLALNFYEDEKINIIWLKYLKATDFSKHSQFTLESNLSIQNWGLIEAKSPLNSEILVLYISQKSAHLQFLIEFTLH